MDSTRDLSLTDRVLLLEREIRRTRLAAGASALALVVLASAGFAWKAGDPELVRAKRFELVDDRGVVRVSMGQDPKDTQRRARSAGITVHDGTGAERGGFATFDDGSVVFAMDAPTGVGSPMPDRLGLRVDSDGSSHVLLIDNETRGVAKLYSDGKGGGGVQVFDWDLPAKKVRVKTLGFHGEQVETVSTGN